MSGYISNTIASILSNGIALELESDEEEEYYIMKLQEYFASETDFPAYLRGEKVLEIEDSDMQIAMEVTIQQSTLYIMPYSQDVLEIFTEILKFIANNHKHILREFRGVEENKIQSIGDITSTKEIKPDETQETEEEPNSDDDFEWI